VRTLLLVVTAWACTPQKNDFSVLRVLTYSSMNSKDGLSEVIAQHYQKICTSQVQSAQQKQPLSCEIQFVSEEGDINLASSFAKNKRYHAVLGLDQWQVLTAQKHRPSFSATLFAKGPYAILVNTKIWPSDKALPRTWDELKQVAPQSLILQDPRMSPVGLGWLRALNVHNLINKAEARRIVFRVFPSWSLSYSAFLEGAAPLIWTYHSSEAYHRCSEKVSHYKALELKEGYPTQEEWFLAAKEAPQKNIALLKETLLSHEVQSSIPLKNWMWPAHDEVPLPECFQKLGKINSLIDPTPQESVLNVQTWLDDWSL
jgi:thiamine transport system substrate-binding protein